MRAWSQCYCAVVVLVWATRGLSSRRGLASAQSTHHHLAPSRDLAQRCVVWHGGHVHVHRCIKLHMPVCVWGQREGSAADVSVYSAASDGVVCDGCLVSLPSPALCRSPRGRARSARRGSVLHWKCRHPRGSVSRCVVIVGEHRGTCCTPLVNRRCVPVLALTACVLWPPEQLLPRTNSGIPLNRTWKDVWLRAECAPGWVMQPTHPFALFWEAFSTCPLRCPPYARVSADPPPTRIAPALIRSCAPLNL